MMWLAVFGLLAFFVSFYVLFDGMGKL